MRVDLPSRYINDTNDLARGESTSENRDRGTLESRGILQRPVYREQVLASLPSVSSLLILSLSLSISPAFISLLSSPSFSLSCSRHRAEEALVSTGTHLACTCTHTYASRNAQDGLRCE